MTVLVIQHVAPEGPGALREALRAVGQDLRLVRADLGELVPTTLGDHDGLIVLGGPMGVGDLREHAHLRDTCALLRDALDMDDRVLGICLGSQLLAHVLGARVRPGPAIELGWKPVHAMPGAAQDPCFGALPATLPALHWHGDVLDLPEGAVHLARSEATAVQAFQWRRALGLLFHLEADVAQVEAMCAAFPHETAAARTTTEALLADTRAYADQAAALAHRLCAAWWSAPVDG